MRDDQCVDEYFERLVDKNSLRKYLKKHIGDTDVFEIKRHHAGHSNETLFLSWAGEQYVIRRPPPGETADQAHDVLREYEVISALQNTDIPVPEVILACDDESVIGSDFYLTKRLSGEVLRNEEPQHFATRKYRCSIGVELVDVLATIHELDYDEVGLDDFGRPENFTKRQVERWMAQLKWAFEVTKDERPVPKLQNVGAWLAANLPTEHDSTLVHGDFKLDNVMYSPSSPPEIIGVFDWELSTLGDPMTDLGWLLAFWRDPTDLEPAIPELIPSFVERSGYPSRADLVARYERKTGRTLEHNRFYRVLAVFKLASLGEMFFRRYLEGNGDDSLYPVMEDRVPQLADRACGIINGREPL